MPTINALPNESGAAVFAAGQATFRVQFETYKGSGQECGATGVTISIVASGATDSGTGSPVPVTSAGIAQLAEGLFEYTWTVAADAVPGSYVVTWTGNRSTDDMTVTYTQTVDVAPDPESVPLPGCYASVKQYRDRTNDQFTPAERVQVALQLATEDIDLALLAAVYPVDADGMPSNPQQAVMIARATAAQCQYVLAVNDDAGVKSEYSSTSIAGLSQVRAARMQAGALRPVCRQSLGILRTAGVLPSSVMIGWG